MVEGKISRANAGQLGRVGQAERALATWTNNWERTQYATMAMSFAAMKSPVNNALTIT